MSVVKSNQPLATWAVQRQRVLQPMRPLGRTSDTADRKGNPVLALRIDYKYPAGKIQQHVRSWIPIMTFLRLPRLRSLWVEASVSEPAR
jgi:hypothetical protein